MQISFQPIGIIHTPFSKLEGMPIQPSSAVGIRGEIELREEFSPALQDLEGFSHIYLLYYFHKSTSFRLKVKPFLEDKEHGLFATRAPQRPNPIGLSLVKLISITGNLLAIENVDILDGTPLLDIKPFIKQMEPSSLLRIGWLEKHKSLFPEKKSDQRFIE